MDPKIIALIAPIVLAELLLRVIALVSLARAEKVKGPKAAWALAILLINVFGWVAYFLFAREEA